MEIKTTIHRDKELFQSLGKFRFTVLVSGDNVKPVSKKLEFDWNGQWNKFTLTESD